MSKMQRPPHILFADDDETTIALFKYHTEQRGWEGDYAFTGREALAKVSALCTPGNHCYDVVVMDINFADQHPDLGPRVTGITAAWQIRRSYPDLPILFVSAFSNLLVREEVDNVGGEMIQKPFDFDALFDRIDYLIKWHRTALCDSCRSGGLCKSGCNDVSIKIPDSIDEAITKARRNVAQRDYITLIKGGTI